MPLVSVLTPTQAHNADWIGEAWASLLAQDDLPGGWEWEWVVQEDGEAPAVAERLPDDARVRFAATGVQAGAPATRNAALVRARGELVACLDHDDAFVAGGLGALVAALVADPASGWACGRARLLLPDGEHTWEKPDVLPAGRVAPGAISAYYRATGDWPFPAAFTTFRRTLLLAHGGWPAVASSDDAVLLAAFSHLHPGVWLDRTVVMYRRWDRQKSVQPAHWRLRDQVRETLLARDAALRAVHDT